MSPCVTLRVIRLINQNKIIAFIEKGTVLPLNYKTSLAGVSHWSYFMCVSSRGSACLGGYQCVFVWECFCVINGLEVARDGAVMLDYMQWQAPLHLLIDHIIQTTHIPANFQHQCMCSSKLYECVCLCLCVWFIHYHFSTVQTLP